MTVDMAELNILSADIRRRRARTLQDIRAGQITLAQILDSPPVEVASLPLLDLLRLLPGMGHARASFLNRAAVKDGINLMSITGKASGRTREWVAGHVVPLSGPKMTVVYPGRGNW